MDILFDNQGKWWIALLITVIAMLLFSPPTVQGIGSLFEGFGASPQVNYSGSPLISLFIFQSLLFLLITRLIFQLIPAYTTVRWQYAVIATIIAMLVFAPFFTSAVAMGSNGNVYTGWLILLQGVIYLAVLRLSFM